MVEDLGHAVRITQESRTARNEEWGLVNFSTSIPMLTIQLMHRDNILSITDMDEMEEVGKAILRYVQHCRMHVMEDGENLRFIGGGFTYMKVREAEKNLGGNRCDDCGAVQQGGEVYTCVEDDVVVCPICKTRY